MQSRVSQSHFLSFPLQPTRCNQRSDWLGSEHREHRLTSAAALWHRSSFSRGAEVCPSPGQLFKASGQLCWDVLFCWFFKSLHTIFYFPQMLSRTWRLFLKKKRKRKSAWTPENGSINLYLIQITTSCKNAGSNLKSIIPLKVPHWAHFRILMFHAANCY